MNIMNAMIEANKTYKVVKACVYKRGNEFATVLCTVAPEEYGLAEIRQMRDGSRRPSSYGTWIRVVGRNLMTPMCYMTLTNYERYLNKEGWEFAFSVKEVRGKSIREAFQTCHATIRIARKILR